MPPINLTPPSYSILVGGLDITNWVDNLSIRRPLPSLSRPLSWEGSFEISTPANYQSLPESLDDWENPQRWLPGNHPVELWLQSKLIATMRISGYSYDSFTNDELRAKVEVTDLLSFLDFKKPGKDYEGLGYDPCSTVSVKTHINNLLSQSGVGVITDSSLDNLPDSVIKTPPSVSGSYLGSAQKYLGERGYYLYLKPNETPSAAKFSASEGTLATILSLGELVGSIRLENQKIPYTKIQASASYKRFSNCGKRERTEVVRESEYKGTKFISYREVQELIKNTNTKEVWQTTIDRAIGDIWPDWVAEKGLNPTIRITESVQERTLTYSLEEGRLEKDETRTDKILGACLPEDFPGNESWIPNAETKQILYKETPNLRVIGEDIFNYPQGVLRYIETTQWKQFLVNDSGVSGSTEKLISSRRVQFWKDEPEVIGNIGGINQVSLNPNCCDRYSYQEWRWEREKLDNTYSESSDSSESNFTKPGSLVLRDYRQSPDSTPPSWKYKEPRCPTCEETVKEEIDLESSNILAGNPLQERILEISASTLQSEQALRNFARNEADKFLWRKKARQFEIEIPDWWVNNPSPFPRALIHNGYYILANASLVIENREATLAFQGYRYAKVSSPVPEPTITDLTNPLGIPNPARTPYESNPPSPDQETIPHFFSVSEIQLPFISEVSLDLLPEDDAEWYIVDSNGVEIVDSNGEKLYARGE